MTPNRKVFLIPITLLLLTFAGCIKKSATVSESFPATSLRWATTTPPQRQDWTECATEECLRHASLVMEGLFRIDDKTAGAAVQPQLAASVDNQGDREYRIDLRRNVRWSDGKELVAKDFVDSWKRVLFRCRSIAASHLLFPISGAETYCKRKHGFNKVEIKTLGSHTIVLRLQRPAPFFLRVLAHPVTWPRRLDSRDTLPTLGPYSRDDSGQTFRRNPDYHGSAAPIEQIEFVSVATPEEGIGLYRERSVDVVDGLHRELSNRLNADPDRILVPTSERVFLVLDSQVKPFQSLSTRKAFAESIQTQELIEVAKQPVLLAHSLNRELSPVSQPPGQKPKLQERAEPIRPALTWRIQDDLGWLADNLRAQWNKTLGVDIEMTPGKQPSPTAGLRIVLWRRTVLSPAFPLSFFPSPFLTPTPRAP